ncbi:MAG: hypothetical protein KA035_01760 [Candidatus Levybacteria bacterium]|nr:hypothetical protein [Candidatus Levybacteria bacterium]
MLEIEDHKKPFKIIAVITIAAVIVFFLFIPVVMLGSTLEFYSDSAVDSLDKLDNTNNFTPGDVPRQTMLQKIQSAF